MSNKNIQQPKIYKPINNKNGYETRTVNYAHLLENIDKIYLAKAETLPNIKIGISNSEEYIQYDNHKPVNVLTEKIAGSRYSFFCWLLELFKSLSRAMQDNFKDEELNAKESRYQMNSRTILYHKFDYLNSPIFGDPEKMAMTIKIISGSITADVLLKGVINKQFPTLEISKGQPIFEALEDSYVNHSDLQGFLYDLIHAFGNPGINIIPTCKFPTDNEMIAEILNNIYVELHLRLKLADL